MKAYEDTVKNRGNKGKHPKTKTGTAEERTIKHT